jgi:hypothetical protein
MAIKRTTPFQKLIKNIYAQLEPDEIVIESGSLPEKHAKSDREIDVFIKKKVLGKERVIVIECREWAKKNNIKWIDEIIGKYIDMEVDEIIAVSKSGFYEPAKDKAKAHNIKTLKLEDAENIDWKSELLNLTLGKITSDDFPKSITLKTNPSVSIVPAFQMQVFSDGYVGTLDEFARTLYQAGHSKINEMFNDKVLNLDGGSKFSLSLSCPVTRELYFLANEEKIQILEITLEIERVFSEIEEVDSSKYSFDNNAVMEGKIRDEGKIYQIIGTQKRGEKPIIESYLVEDITKKAKKK